MYSSNPSFSSDVLISLLRTIWGMEASLPLKFLPSERDQNVHVTNNDSQYVLKIAFVANEDRSNLDAQHEILRRLKPFGVAPVAVPALSGQEIVEHEGHFMRVLTYIEGVPLARLQLEGADLENLGSLMARMGDELRDVDHPSLHRRAFQWDLVNYEAVVRKHLEALGTGEFRNVVEKVFNACHAFVSPHLKDLPKQVIHNDLNVNNVVRREDGTLAAIDFGDVSYTWSIADPAIAIAYSMLEMETTDPKQVSERVLKGFRILSESERVCVFPLAALRLCTSAVVAATQSASNPSNSDYLTSYQEKISRVMPRLFASLTSVTFRVAQFVSDEEFWVRAVEEVLALEGTIEWSPKEEQTQRKNWRNYVAQGTALMVLDYADVVCGFATWEVGSHLPYKPESCGAASNKFAWVGVSYIVPSHRKLGLATKLYRQVQVLANGLGVVEFQLDVYEKNQASISFHSRLGFVNYASVFRRAVKKKGENLLGKSGFEIRNYQDSDADYVQTHLSRDSKFDVFLSHHSQATSIVARSGNVVGFFCVFCSDMHPFGVSYGKYEYRYLSIHDFYLEDPEFELLPQLDLRASDEGVDWILSGIRMDFEQLNWLTKHGFDPYVRIFEWK